jgi:hypothetical protein
MANAKPWSNVIPETLRRWVFPEPATGEQVPKTTQR